MNYTNATKSNRKSGVASGEICGSPAVCDRVNRCGVVPGFGLDAHAEAAFLGNLNETVFRSDGIFQLPRRHPCHAG